MNNIIGATSETYIQCLWRNNLVEGAHLFMNLQAQHIEEDTPPDYGICNDVTSTSNPLLSGRLGNSIKAT